MNSLAIRAIQSETLNGFQFPLGPISAAGWYKVQQNSADGNVWATVNGGAWFPFLGAFGPIVTLQQAYDGGGAVGSGLGRSITTMTAAASAVVMTNSAANGNNVLELSKTPAAPQIGSALSVTSGANAVDPSVLITNNSTQAGSIGILMFATPGVATAANGYVIQTATTVTNAGSAFLANLFGPMNGIEVFLLGAATGGPVLALFEDNNGGVAGGARAVTLLQTLQNSSWTANGSISGPQVIFANNPTSTGAGVVLTMAQPIVSITHTPQPVAGDIAMRSEEHT